jgi:hypothetical protein
MWTKIDTLARSDSSELSGGPGGECEVHYSLDYAPDSDSLARELFDEATIEAHLDHLAQAYAQRRRLTADRLLSQRGMRILWRWPNRRCASGDKGIPGIIKLIDILIRNRKLNFLAALAARHDNPFHLGRPGRIPASLDRRLTRFKIIFHSHYYSKGQKHT